MMLCMKKSVPVSCNRDCGCGCALQAETDDGRVERIVDMPSRPEYMRGCLKGYRAAEQLCDEQRLLQPLLRTGERGSGDFAPISWDHALDRISEELEKRREGGCLESILRLGGSGSCRGALHNTELLSKRFFSLLGGYTDTTGNFSCQASDFVKPFMYGTPYVGQDIRSLEDSAAVVLWGFNPFETRFGSETEAFLLHLRRRGTPFYLIDPRKTLSASRLGARWFSLRPGGDGALLSALIYEILRSGRGALDTVRAYSVGIEELYSYLDGKEDGVVRNGSWAAGYCGLSLPEIEELTDLFLQPGPVALLPGLSVQRTLGGEEVDRLLGVLQLVSGNASLPGGSVGSGQWNRLPKPSCPRIPVPPCRGEKRVAVYQWADLVLRGRSGGYPSDPDLLYCVGGNYIGQASDLQRTRKAFHSASFSVVHELFMTETARHCDLVLPVKGFLEREDICFSNANYLLYSAPAMKAPNGVKSDYQIFSLLARRLGFEDAFCQGRGEEEWIDHFIVNSSVEDAREFKRSGIWIGSDRKRRGLAAFFADPEKNPLNTPSGKIEIASRAYREAGGPLIPKAWLPDRDPGYPFDLVTPKEKFRVHSQFDNLPRFKRLCDDSLWIHPDDAGELGLSDGDAVILESRSGRGLFFLSLKYDICPGVLSLHQGAWPRFYREYGIWGDSVNLLTSDQPTMPSRGSRTHSVQVRILAVTS